MIDAAERLIAERGLAAVTLQDVQQAAGQSNRSAAKYHFGSRDGLLDAIIEARMSPVDECRERLLADLQAQGSPPDVRRAVESLVLPLAAETLGRKGSRYARFLSQAMFDPALAETLQKHLRAESFRRAEEIVISIANAPRDIAEWRSANIVNLAITTLARWEDKDRSLVLTARIISELIDSCVAILEARVSAATSDQGLLA
ncbi:TetR/AcrR family transcriptional regulator [Nocardia sp. SYP-A9097]|uniref:TetR/AcrR family transcriptional regulator n=1 Tax=Nocardia sp. SYP-A9097 TaxID=2663237 RepID=UPI001E56F6C2|nr:TetR/AcrR family transcriptional regulator [Nocardia sp. SYP-A9097]